MKSILVLIFSGIASLAIGQQVTPIPAANAVEVLFIKILKRQLPNGGSGYFADQLNSCRAERGLRDVILQIVSSDEYTTSNYYTPLVEYGYKVMLDRSPDSGGAQYFVNLLARGGTTKDLYKRILHSEEFEKRYVINMTPSALSAKLMHIILDRDPNEVPTSNYWVEAISREGYRQVVNRLFETEEYNNRFGNFGAPGNKDLITNFVNNLFKTFLQRSAAPDEMLKEVQKKGLGVAINSIVLSEEYYKKFGNWLIPDSPVKYRLVPPQCTPPAAASVPPLSIRGTFVKEEAGILYYRPVDSLGSCTFNLASISVTRVISKNNIGKCTATSAQSGSKTFDFYEFIIKP